MTTTVHIPETLLNQIAKQVMASPAAEICGLLAGTGNAVSAVIPVPNTSATPHTSFTMSPQSLLKQLKAMDDAGLEWIGTYHSHPGKNTFPSQADIKHARENLPDKVMLIASAAGKEVLFQAWRMTWQDVERVELTDEPMPDDNTLSPITKLTTVISMLSAMIVLIVIAISLLPPAPDLSAL